ncbi:MAG: carboxypeptidase regulatory-like domain-containing protein [Candidatus Rokubacteria bacterium]|nr:carboxypeptidase regulatory-like domain-containing protein [Candidatus Rokubacteria bacterium]
MTSRVVALASLLLALAGPAAAAYEEVPVSDGGTLTGVLRFAGTPPKLPTLAVNKNRDVCGESKPSEALVVGADRGVKGGVVLIEGITRGKKPAGDVVIDNAKCVFVPHVAATMVGGRAKVRNSDPILHNTHGFLGKPTIFNVALPNKEQVVDITRRLTRTGPVRVLCDAHPHMMAWLYVHDSPYVATTDDRGAYRIDGVPPGTYKVTMWHQGFRPKGTDKDGRPLFDEPITVTKDLTIGPKATATLDFELK